MELSWSMLHSGQPVAVRCGSTFLHLSAQDRASGARAEASGGTYGMSFAGTPATDVYQVWPGGRLKRRNARARRDPKSALVSRSVHGHI